MTAQTILPANTLSSGYDITNSARFTASSTGHMERTFDHAGNRKVWTFSTWIKRSVLGVERGIFGSAINSSGTNAVNAIFFYHTGDTIRVWTQNGETAIVSGGQFRDTSAWLHLVWTAQSSSPYYKVYVNGTEINYATDNRSSYPSTNDSEINQNNVIHYIGGWKNGSDQSVSSYMADTYFLDGYTYDPSYFGETDSDSGIWKPKKYAEGNYGNNGFHLEYKETGTSANASGMGADTSGNGNHFTPQNMTAEDISTDTPTNNYATLNPLSRPPSSNLTLSEGNLLVNGNATDAGAKATFGVSSGKWYWEIKANEASSGSDRMLVATEDVKPITSALDANNQGIWGIQSRSGSGATLNSYTNGTFNNGNSGSTGYNDDVIISVALDADNGKLYFAKDGTYTDLSGNTGNPANGTNPTFTGLPTDGTFLFPYVENRVSNATPSSSVNFGNPPFSISSGNSDANGYGNFEHSVPSGYYALNSKNLAEYG